MATRYVLILLIIYPIVSYSQESPHLVSTTDTSLIGSSTTLICTWEKSVDSLVKKVVWTKNGIASSFNLDICDIAPGNDDAGIFKYATISPGYLHQLLTFENVTEELNTFWSCGGNEVKINTTREQKLRLTSPSVTTWYGSSFTFTCTYNLDLDIEIDRSSWFINGTFKFDIDGNCTVCGANDEPVEYVKANCSSRQHQVTLTEVTSEHSGRMWHCLVKNVKSNEARVIVFENPDWPDVVIVNSTQDRNISTMPTVSLTCHSRCEDGRYEFHWHIPSGNISDIDYQRCSSTCSQNLTLEILPSYYNYDVICTVTNMRTKKTVSGTYQLDIPPHVTMTPEQHSSISKDKYIWIGLAIGIVVIIIICIVVVILCKRKTKSTTSDEVMMDNVLYTSSGTFSSQPESKPVMEDNVLYESSLPEA